MLWTDSAEAGYGASTSFPAGFCTSGFSNLNAAFIVSLLIDLGFQVSTLTRLLGRRVALLGRRVALLGNAPPAAARLPHGTTKS